VILILNLWRMLTMQNSNEPKKNPQPQQKPNPDKKSGTAGTSK
jgi:hypothetical protein